MLHTKVVDAANPIMAGMKDWDHNEEAFHTITWAKTPVHALVTVAMPGGTKKTKSSRRFDLGAHAVSVASPRARSCMQGTCTRPQRSGLLSDASARDRGRRRSRSMR